MAEGRKKGQTWREIKGQEGNGDRRARGGKRSKKLKFIKRVATCNNSGESSDDRRTSHSLA